MRILFIGDIVGRVGRDMALKALPALVEAYDLDLVIANAENAAAGFGLTPDIGETLLSHGIDILTSGNHVWDKKEVIPYIGREPRLLRPANFPPEVPGRGAYVTRTSRGESAAVVNVMGRVFMTPLDNPFTVVLDEIARVRERARVVIVDFHAEATSEKVAMGWHLAGRVTAVIGTHTHVQTADEQILPGGTAYVTDVGMTGPHESIIGMDKDTTLARFLTGMPARLEPASGNVRLNAIVITADAQTGLASAIERLNLSAADIEVLGSRPVPAS